MTLTPAYGRDYKNKTAVLADWEAAKDFIIADPFTGGQYCNKIDAEKFKPGESIWIRYAKLTKIVQVK